MNETPEQKAKRIGVPLIHKNNWPYKVPMEQNMTVSVCGECGIEIKQVMGYVCPKGGCPAGLGEDSMIGRVAAAMASATNATIK